MESIGLFIPTLVARSTSNPAYTLDTTALWH